MKKRIFAFLLAVLCVVTLCPAEVLAEGIETASPDPISEPILVEEQVYINPEYADSVSPEDIPKLPKTEASDVADLSEEYVSLNEAVTRMRSNFIDRVSTVYGYVKIAKSSVPSDTDAWNYVYDRISANIFNHTGNPEAGDYLERHFGGYSYGGEYSYDSTYYYVTVKMAPGYYTTKAQEDQVGAKINTVLSGMNLEGQSDFYIAKSIYDYICDNVTYDHYSSSNMKYTAYNAIMTGTSVCQGYATLYYRMALTAGLDARYIRGYANGGNHGWNIVRIGDKYYNADTTWDAGSSRYYYCFVNDANFTDHTRRDQYLTSDFYAKYPMSSTNFNLNASALYISSVQASTKAAKGNKVSISVNVAGSGLSYQWWVKNEGDTAFTRQSSITGSTYTAIMGSEVKNREVYCVIRDSYSNAVRTKTYTLELQRGSNDLIVTQPVTSYTCMGKTASVSLEAVGDGLQYQWYVQDIGDTEWFLSRHTTNTYKMTMSEENAGRKAYCVVTDGEGYSQKSNIVELRLKATILTQPEPSYTKYGKTAKVSVEAVGDELSYVWYVQDINDTEWFLSRHTTDTYKMTMSEESAGRKAYCKITDKYGYTQCSEIVVLYPAATIMTQPKHASASVGSVAKTTLRAMGDGLTYTWYIKTPGKTSFSKSSVTTSYYSMRMSETNAGRQAYCVVKDRYGKTAKSNIVTFGLPVKLTSQSKTTYTRQGATAKATVRAKGDGLTYQWYLKNAGATQYSKSSITSATYSVKMSSTSKDRLVYCIITDQYGNSVRSETVRLRMAATITAQPKSVSAANGTVASTSVTAVGDGLTYQWYLKNPGKTSFSKSSVTTASYACKMTEKIDGRQVYCVVTDKYGKTHKSNTATLTLG